MNRHAPWLAALASSAILLTGCASTNAPTAAPAPPSPAASSSAVTSGMDVTDDEMAAMDQGPGPSGAAKMVCSDEIKDAVTKALKLDSPPSTTDDWAKGTYTCTYQLSIGPLVLSVQDATTAKSGRQYFDKLRGGTADVQALNGMQSFGLPSYQTPDGTVVFLKDGKTLRVDATKLPAKVPPYHRSRTDLAYTIATNVIACWSE